MNSKASLKATTVFIAIGTIVVMVAATFALVYIPTAAILDLTSGHTASKGLDIGVLIVVVNLQLSAMAYLSARRSK